MYAEIGICFVSRQNYRQKGIVKFSSKFRAKLALILIHTISLVNYNNNRLFSEQPTFLPTTCFNSKAGTITKFHVASCHPKTFVNFILINQLIMQAPHSKYTLKYFCTLYVDRVCYDQYVLLHFKTCHSTKYKQA